MSDTEWAFLAPFIVAVQRATGLKLASHRLVRGVILGVARTAAPWRDLTEEFGKWSSVYR